MELWRSIVIIFSCIFIEKFNFKAGYSLAYCEARGINLNQNNPEDD